MEERNERASDREVILLEVILLEKTWTRGEKHQSVLAHETTRQVEVCLRDQSRGEGRSGRRPADLSSFRSVGVVR
eukprot:scaffold67421_cov33-Tisochrysis_lutea.AAC.2